MNTFVAAVLSFFLGYMLAQLNAFVDRSRRRVAIATAMLADLDALDLILRQVEEFGHSSPLLELLPRMDVIERTADYVGVLSIESVRALLTLNIILKATRRNIEAIDRSFAPDGARRTETQKLKLQERQEHLIRSTAVELLARTADVRRLLKKDGAVSLDVPRLSAPEQLRLP